MKNVLILLGMFLYVVGVFGGIGYSLYYGEKPIALGIAVLAVMAFPTAKKWWKILAE